MTKKEINFYQIDDVIVKSMAPLLLKVLDEKKKALIFSKDQAKIKEIDDRLWQFSKTKFVPHATIFEKDIEDLSTWSRQPVLISNEEENKNEADYLILTEDSSSEFIEKFSRSFYFYDSMMLENVKKFAKNIAKDFSVKSYKKIDGKWQNFALV